MVDPVTGLMLHNKINAATEALFHTNTPDGCPDDPIEKQSFLAAHAMLNLIEGNGVRMGRPAVHTGGWQLHLADDRTLTITYPDQTTMTTGPPRRRAA